MNVRSIFGNGPNPNQTTNSGATAIFGITLAGVLYEIYLTYVEIWVIDAICPWCVTFAIVTLLILIVEGWHVWRLVNE